MNALTEQKVPEDHRYRRKLESVEDHLVPLQIRQETYVEDRFQQ